MTSTLDEPTRTGSAYPPDLDQLLPRARELPEYENGLPSRNQVMKTLKIGPDKAKAVLEKLAAERATEPGPVPGHDVLPTEDVAEEEDAEVAGVASPGTDGGHGPDRPLPVWPLILLAAPAFVAIWSGWVGLGGLTGFGVVHPLPGIADKVSVNTAITLPIGLETYAAYALRAWLSTARATPRARRFAKWSALGSLAVGGAGQVVYHLLVAAGVERAPWPVVVAVSCLPVIVLAMGTALAQLLREGR